MFEINNIYLVLAVVVVWFLLALTVIKADERGVKVLFGRPRKVVESGLRFTWWPFEVIIRYPTTIVEIEKFKPARIVTKSGKVRDDQTKYGPGNIQVTSSLRFYWPEDENQLIEAVKSLPGPQDKDKGDLKSIFEEPILEHIRTCGGQRIWIQITRDRKEYAKAIMDSWEADPDSILNKVALQNPKVIIDHLDIPDDLKNAINAPEVARLTGKATITTALATKEKDKRDAEAKAYAKRKIFDAIGVEPIDIQKETLLTLREMANGTSTTILPIPTNLLDAMEDIFGSGKVGKIMDYSNLDFKKMVAELSVGQISLLQKLLTEGLKEVKA